MRTTPFVSLDIGIVTVAAACSKWNLSGMPHAIPCAYLQCEGTSRGSSYMERVYNVAKASIVTKCCKMLGCQIEMSRNAMCLPKPPKPPFSLAEVMTAAYC